MRKVFIFAFAACVFGTCFRPIVLADTIILKDGRNIEWTITEEGNDNYTIKIKIGTMKVNKDTIKEIKKSPAEENFGKRDNVKSGFGLTIESSGGRTTLATVIPGGNAENVGFKPKDEIIRINDMDTKGKSLHEITDYLVKSDNTTFAFLIQRECELTRKKINYQKHSFVGVGIFLDAAGNDLVINSIIVGEPADLAGLKSKDKVVSIEGKPASGMSVDDAANLIGGPESSNLKIAIQRSVELERK